MSMLPFAALWLVLAAVGIASLALRSRPGIRNPLNVLTVLGACGLWLWGRPSSTDNFPTGSFLDYDFAIPTGVWQLTGVALVALLAIVVWNWLNAPEQSEDAMSSDTSLPLLMGVSLLPFIWAGEPLTAATFLGLFLAAIGLAVWRSHRHTPYADVPFLPFVTLLLLPLLLIWFAYAVALSGTVTPLWAELSSVAVLVAAAALLGAWPLAGWRQGALRERGFGALALISLPPVAAAAVLLPVAQQLFNSSAQLVVAIVVGFLSILMGLRWIWRGTNSGRQSVSGLACALGGLVLLTAVFADEYALLATTRLAVFAPLLVWFLAREIGRDADMREAGTESSGKWLSAIAAGVVWLLVLGLPLTVGFVSISSLYEGWLADGNYFQIAILCLLLIIWSAVLFRPVVAAVQARRHSDRAPTGALQLSFVAALIPLVALLQVNLAGLGNLTAVTWLAYLLPFVLGPLIAWFVGDRLQAAGWPDANLIPHERLGPIRAGAGRGWGAAGDAVAEAVDILEGPNGLIVALVIIAALLLIS